jgi:hypothetical protein
MVQIFLSVDSKALGRSNNDLMEVVSTSMKGTKKQHRTLK